MGRDRRAKLGEGAAFSHSWTWRRWLYSPAQPKRISRRHAQLRYDAATGRWTLSDLSSVNGTYVNGVKMQRAWTFHLRVERPYWVDLRVAAGAGKVLRYGPGYVGFLESMIQSCLWPAIKISSPLEQTAAEQSAAPSRNPALFSSIGFASRVCTCSSHRRRRRCVPLLMFTHPLRR